MVNRIILSIYACTVLVDPGPCFSFLSYTQSVGLLGLVVSPSLGRYLHTEQYKQNKRIRTSMPLVGFEPTILVFEGAKTVHALHRAAAVITILMLHNVFTLLQNVCSVLSVK
jgi:hypothetical protein